MHQESAESYRLKCLCNICIYPLSFYCLPLFSICLLSPLGLGHKSEDNGFTILLSGKEPKLPQMTDIPNLYFTNKGQGVQNSLVFLISFDM